VMLLFALQRIADKNLFPKMIPVERLL
jgi:hypothetical protein